MQDEHKFETLNEVSQNMRGLLQEYGLGNNNDDKEV